MSVSWDCSEDAIWFACVSDSYANAFLYLVVEKLPRSKGWDWAVWHPKWLPSERSGKARSASAAAMQAEIAASRWMTGELPRKSMVTNVPCVARNGSASI
jgi:hypothetical protein